MGLCYVSHILAHLRGRLRRRAEGGAGSGVLRPRLVTKAPGGPGPRPPGITTWLRGARCTDPEEMPEKEARPPTQNRHGGAPRGERPAAVGRAAPQQARIVAPDSATTEILRLSALRSPLIGADGKEKSKTRAQKRAAGTKKTALFDIVNRNVRQRTRSRPSARRAASFVARMERSVIRVVAGRDDRPAFRGACHRAALRADPLAPCGLRAELVTSR
jgi:hypothetical protein